MQYILPIVISYLLGSISFSYLMGRMVRNIDIRSHGSGNAGATNTLRVLGVGPAITVLALDIVKGIGAIWIGYAFADGQTWIPVLSGLSVIAGHNWPIFFGFRGGKGIATTIGVMATLCFLPALFAGIIAIIAVAVTRYVSLGSLLFTGLLPIAIWLMGHPVPILIASLIVAVFAFYKHRKNIIKLVQGQENKLGTKASSN